MSTEYQEKILNTLKTEKTLGKIIEETSLSYDKLTRPLASLLNREEIEMCGFLKKDEENDKKINKFATRNIIFRKRLPHKTFTDIYSLLNQFESSDAATFDESMLELKGIFEKKFRQLESLQKNIWNNLNNNIADPISLKDYIDVLEDQLLTIDTNDEISNYETAKIKELLSICKAWHNENKNITVWRFKEDYEDNLKEYLEINNSRSSYKQVYYPYVRKGRTAYQIFDNSNLSILQHAKRPLFDLEGDWDSTIFLRMKGLEEPFETMRIDLQKIFSKILFYVNSHKNYKFMKMGLSWAFSDENDSIEWFRHFINNITFSDEKLKNELGIGPYGNDHVLNEMMELNKRLDGDSQPNIDQFATFMANKWATEFKEWANSH